MKITFYWLGGKNQHFRVECINDPFREMLAWIFFATFQLRNIFIARNSLKQIQSLPASLEIEGRIFEQKKLGQF